MEPKAFGSPAPSGGEREEKERRMKKIGIGVSVLTEQNV